MASLRRSTTTPNDGTMSKFLYTIMKQLDHKSIDWNMVASELSITNGHAARMRFSRFRQHMDGIVPGTRKPRKDSGMRKKANGDKKRKRKKEDEDDDGHDHDHRPVKQEQTGPERKWSRSSTATRSRLIKSEDHIKEEPRIKEESMGYDTNDYFQDLQSTETSFGHMGVNEALGIDPFDGGSGLAGGSSAFQGFDQPLVKMEPCIKMEPEDRL